LCGTSTDRAARRRGVKFGRNAELAPEQIDHAWKLIDKVEGRQYVANRYHMRSPQAEF
jgi:hypothetical protein